MEGLNHFDNFGQAEPTMSSILQQVQLAQNPNMTFGTNVVMPTIPENGILAEADMVPPQIIVPQDPQNARARRVTKGKQYANKYRLKIAQRQAQLESEEAALKQVVEIISPHRIKIKEAEISLLQAENIALKQNFTTLFAELSFKEAQCASLKNERELQKMTYEVYHQQLSQTLFQFSAANAGGSSQGQNGHFP